MSGTVQSNNVYLNATNTISVVGAGGGAVSPNLEVSTLSAFALTNISSINGAVYTGAGSVPANLTLSSLSTLALNSISSINGVAYTGAGAVPANLGVSSLIVNAGDLTVLNNAAAPTQGRAILDGTSAGFALTGFNDANAQTTFIQSADVGGSQQLDISVGSSTNSRITIDQTAGTTISSLTVSSFNGARAQPFSAGSFNLGISSFSTTQNNGQFPISGVLTTFSTTVGHTYVVDFTAFITPSQPSVDPATIPTDAEMGFSVNSGAVSIQGNSLQAKSVYELSRGQRSTFTVADTISFIAGATGAGLFSGYICNNAAASFNFTNTTVISSASRVVVTDIGVI